MWWLVKHNGGQVMINRPESRWRPISFVVFDSAGYRVKSGGVEGYRDDVQLLLQELGEMTEREAAEIEAKLHALIDASPEDAAARPHKTGKRD